VESNDNIHVVWSDYTPGSPEIYYRRSINGGVTWGNVKRLSWNSGGSYTPAIAADSNDNIHVVWHDDTPGSSEIYYKRSTNGGVSWSGANRLTWSSGVSYNPAITADSSDNLHIVWHGFSPGSLEIYYKRSTNGGVAWGSAKRLSWTSGDSQIAEIAVDTSDNLHVVWQDKSPGDFDIYHKRSTNGGVNWSGTHRITWTFKGSYAPSIDIDSSNSIHLVWYDYTPGNYEIFYRKGIQ
jgi:hypothetical protein